ncbi:MAG: NmrA family protein, partial [Rhodospirillales bacterium]|nr:NmrA family protein [Rhodospirillales bacterium]
MGEAMKTVLITGLRGKTGRQVAQALLGRKEVVVRGAARNPASLTIPGISVSRFAWEDPVSWPDALSGVHAVYFSGRRRPTPPKPSHPSWPWRKVSSGS